MLRTGNDDVLKEFYDSVKRCNTVTMNLRAGPGGPISMPEGNKGMEWFGTVSGQACVLIWEVCISRNSASFAEWRNGSPTTIT